MKSRRLLWHIFPANILTILITVCLVSWYGSTATQNFYFQETAKNLKARAILIRPEITRLLQTNTERALRHYCMKQGRESGTRITIIAKNGRVLADSDKNPETMENHRQREEIVTALAGKTGLSRHFSKTIGEQMVYVAIPLYISTEKKADYVLRAAVSASLLQKTLQQIISKIVMVSLAVAALAALITLIISRNISRPLESMTKNAKRFAKGDFTTPMLPAVRKGAATEVHDLAVSMDNMGVLLAEKIDIIVSHRNQLETVFSSMIEAVIAIDEKERIISINEAASQLFAIDNKRVQGRLVHQIIRNIDLQQKITRNLKDRQPEEGEISLHNEAGIKYLQTHVVSLRDGLGNYDGVLVVLNDVTRLRQLEVIRRDFIANVSHELRTPVTSIQGYVETLLDGALENKDDTQHFLKIVLRQARRLTTIFDDLLALSRLEDESREKKITLSEEELLPVIQEAIQTCTLKAEENGIRLDYICDSSLCMTMNSNLIAQALVNLIVNGIIYSHEGGIVTVEASKVKQKILLVVADNGRGIAREHLPRLFERFYRSDKARSRALGGTGLGLAIVKHIVQAHNGEITVESVVQEGTTFTLSFPA